MHSVIIGMGEIGKGLYRVLSEVHEVITYDTKDGTAVLPLRTTVLNICIPGNLDNFIDITVDYIKKLEPDACIIHSTVPICTTDAIQMAVNTLDTKACECAVTHSPVRGKHPVMEEGILTYVKHLGGHDTHIAYQYLTEAGLDVRVHDKALTTELAKILSTTRYGLNLAFLRETEKLCKTLKLEVGEVFTEWEETYNQGICVSGHPELCRPIYQPLGTDYIGGHCVVENAWMLFKDLVTDFTEDNTENLQRFLYSIVDVGKGNRDLK